MKMKIIRTQSLVKFIQNSIVEILIILSTIILLVESKRHSSPLLIEDDGARRNTKLPAECQFGKNYQEIGSTWYADLGPPFGVMYCIKCECIAVPKKRRIVARVQCRNIKNDCPVAHCDDPVLLPGSCCKTCPGKDNELEIPQDIPTQSANDEEERNMKHFAALLTGRTSNFLKRDEMKAMYSTNNPQNFVATARFTFHKKNLYYSFYVSHKNFHPKSIQFIDDSGTILEEHNLISSLNGPMSLYQNTTGKVCGVWKRIPRDYKRLLRDERMHVILIWGGNYQSELALAGRIAKYTALSTELFSSLLEPTPSAKSSGQMAGAGGTAVVSISSGAAPSIHLTVIFNGIFNPDDYADVPINVRIELPEKKEVILDEIQKVKKPSSDINVIEVSSPTSIQNLRLLSRGKLTLSIESRRNPALKIQGHIITRVSCELFQTLLTPNNFESKTRTSGLAWVYVNTDGSLVYNIETDNLDLQKYPEISLMEDNGKRKTILEDLTQSLNYHQAIGTIDKLSPRVLESLYADELVINIATTHEPSLIKGKLMQRPVADATDSFEPILLKRIDLNTPAHIMGMAWLSIDNECSLHYELTINGFFNTQQVFQIYLEEKPIEALGAPVTRKLLDEFSGAHKEGFILGMALSELVKLETSVCYLEIYAKERNELLLRGKLKSTKVPSHCFPMYTDNNVPSVIVPNYHGDSHYLQPETKCYHSGRFYDEAEQWESTQESCTMCTCQNGRIICDPIKCPNVSCRFDEELILRQGECCPTCMSPKIIIETNNSAQRGCYLGDQFHLAGATWHPYLPPNGFDTCATCTCDPVTLEIRCPRIVCPPIKCPEKIAFRPDKKACCKICPEGKVNYLSDKFGGTNNPNVLHDQEEIKEPIKTAEEILSKGGCKAVNTVYENGQEWHPVLASHGEQKCIKCRCKDSVITCDRKRCTRSVCNNRAAVKKKGSISVSEIDECCKSNECRRLRRHHNHRHHKDRNNNMKISSTSTVSKSSSSNTGGSGISTDQR